MAKINTLEGDVKSRSGLQEALSLLRMWGWCREGEGWFSDVMC